MIMVDETLVLAMLDGLQKAFQRACYDNSEQAWIDELDALIVRAEKELKMGDGVPRAR